MERKPFRDIVRSPFREQERNTDVVVRQDDTMNDLLTGGPQDVEQMREQLQERDEVLNLKSKMFHHVVLERRFERYVNIASKKDDVIEDLCNKDLDDLSFAQEQTLLDMLNKEISRLKEDTEAISQSSEEREDDSGPDVEVHQEVNQQQAVKTESDQKVQNLDKEDRKRARQVLEEEGII